MNQKGNDGKKKVIERIEMDATRLDIVMYDKDGQPTSRPLLYVAMNPEDRCAGASFTAEDALASLREWYEKEGKE